MYKVSIIQPNYQVCELTNNKYSNIKVSIPSNTIFTNKLFHNDICNYDESEISLVKSNRDTFLIGGVLKLTSNIYYKDPKSNK